MSEPSCVEDESVPKPKSPELIVHLGPKTMKEALTQAVALTQERFKNAQSYFCSGQPGRPTSI